MLGIGGRPAADDALRRRRVPWALGSKAAALLQSIVKNHALVDGNKRLGWLATAVFLEINGVAMSAASNQDAYEYVIDVAAEHRTVDQIADRLRRLLGGIGLLGGGGQMRPRRSSRRKLSQPGRIGSQ